MIGAGHWVQIIPCCRFMTSVLVDCRIRYRARRSIEAWHIALTDIPVEESGMSRSKSGATRPRNAMRWRSHLTTLQHSMGWRGASGVLMQ